MGLLFFAMLAGGAAGLAGWALVEPSSPGLGDPIAWQRWESLFALFIGGFIGCAIGAVNGWYQGSRVHLLRGLILGLAIGAPAGLIGLQVGGAMAQAVSGQSGVEGLPLGQAILARTLAFIPFGAMIGAVIGAAGLSWKRAAVGALGGAVGGLISGMSFDIVANVFGPLLLTAKGGLVQTGPDGVERIAAEIGGPSRGVLATLLGCSIGLFTAVFARATRTAWVRLHLGRNEGKEWIIDAPSSYLGRSEKAHVPLFGDPNVAPMHACIQRQGPSYLLVDGGSPIGTFVNGYRITQMPLLDGAQIQIGGFTLTFQLRAGAAQRAAEAYRGAPVQAGPPAPGSSTMVAPAVGAAPVSSPPSTPTVAMPSAGPTAAPGALAAIDGPLAGQRFSLDNFEVGRESGPIPLGFDGQVSRRHARLARRPDGQWEVFDLGSTNGTFVNGSRVQSTVLRAGDQVRIGATSFRVE